MCDKSDIENADDNFERNVNEELEQSQIETQVGPFVSAADIRLFLEIELPCYEREDKDDFVYIVKAHDINRIALKLYKLIQQDGKKPKKP